MSLEYIPTKQQVVVVYNGRQLENVTGVWLRRPTPTDLLTPHTDERFIPYIHSSLNHHMKQLYTAFAGAVWMSDKYAIDRA